MARNKSLTKAKENKNDEFYTRLDDIEAEISSHPDYVKHFKDKVVLCNCDDPESSNFYEFFRLHFKQLGIKKLIATHYNAPIVETEERPVLDKKGNPKKDKDGNPKTETVIIKETVVPSYKLEWYGEMLNDDTINLIKTPLNGNGDFRSEECVELLKEADIVVTNPPFSLYREYVAQLVEYGKKFVILGNMNSITYKEIFPLLKKNSIRAGYEFNKTMEFIMPDHYELKGSAYVDENGKKHGFVPAMCWFTNLDLDKNHELLPLTKNYKGNEQKYPKYDNYDAIEVSKITDIPKDYYEMMGVPITFLAKYNPDQFEIIGMPTASSNEGSLNLGVNYSKHIGYKQDGTKTGRTGSTFGACPVFERNDGKSIYYTNGTQTVQAGSCERIFIRRKK